MKDNRKNQLTHWALRASVCLFMLSGTNVLMAQDDVDAEGDEAVEIEDSVAVKKKPKKIDLPTYEMKSVSGKVVDAATGEGLGGVRVQALNNKLYTAMTEEDGSYTISVPKFVTALYFEVSGYNGLQRAIKGESSQDVKMLAAAFKPIYKDGTSVFSVAEATPTTTTAITAESEIENRLNGSVRTISRGGVPAQGAAMFIQGINSLKANAQPLIVVDGVIWDMQYDRTTLHQGFVNDVLNMLDVDDIADIKVLKNGTALYGAKGSNGVIEITTNRGHSQATRINARIYGGFETTPNYVDVMNAGQYRSYLSELIGTYKDSEDNSSNFHVGFLNEDPSYVYYPLYHNNTDWSKKLYRTAFTQNYKVGVQGGDNVAMYNLSLGYTKSDATARMTNFDRLNLRFNTDVSITDQLSTSFDLAYSRSTYNMRDNGWAESYSNDNIASPNVLGLIQSPFLSPYSYVVTWDAENLVNKVAMDKRVYSGKYYTASPNPFLYAQNYDSYALANPYWILRNGKGSDKNYLEQTQFMINVTPKYVVNKNLTISDRFSYILNRTSEKYYLPYSGTPNRFIEGLGTVNSSIKSQYGKETTVFNDFRVEWKKQMAAHFLNAMVGMRLANYTYSNTYIKGYNNSNDKLPNLSYSLSYLNYGGANDTWTNLAYYLNANYNYRNRYFLNAIATMESSSRFGKEADAGLKLFGVRWGVFPSLQAGWLISSEDWFNADWVNSLKLTAGYEMTGNDDIDYYATRTYFQNVKFLNTATALQLANIANPKIQWETNHRFNVGLQTNLFNNRVSLGAEVYLSKTTNLLVRKEVSYLTGLANMWTNEGALRNNGVEVSLSGIIVNTKDWKWQAGFTMGHYSNKITDLPSSNKIKLYNIDETGMESTLYKTINGFTSSVYGKNNVLTANGYAAGVFYGYKTKGVFSTDAEAASAGKFGYLKYPTGVVGDASRDFKAGDVHFVDVNGDGWISEADMVKIGDPNPDIYGNIFTSLNWKRFTLDINFKYSVGNDIYDYQRSQLEQGSTVWNQSTALVNRWRYSGQKTDIPRAMSTTNTAEWVNNERFSDRWIDDGSYLKLKKVRLTYQVPLSLSWLQGLTVFGECNNIFTITKYKGSDPEVSCGNSVLYQGVDAGYLPQSFGCNFGVTFNL